MMFCIFNGRNEFIFLLLFLALIFRLQQAAWIFSIETGLSASLSLLARNVRSIKYPQYTWKGGCQFNLSFQILSFIKLRFVSHVLICFIIWGGNKLALLWVYSQFYISHKYHSLRIKPASWIFYFSLVTCKGFQLSMHSTSGFYHLLLEIPQHANTGPSNFLFYV